MEPETTAATAVEIPPQATAHKKTKPSRARVGATVGSSGKLHDSRMATRCGSGHMVPQRPFGHSGCDYPAPGRIYENGRAFARTPQKRWGSGCGRGGVSGVVLAFGENLGFVHSRLSVLCASVAFYPDDFLMQGNFRCSDVTHRSVTFRTNAPSLLVEPGPCR